MQCPPPLRQLHCDFKLKYPLALIFNLFDFDFAYGAAYARLNTGACNKWIQINVVGLWCLCIFYWKIPFLPSPTWLTAHAAYITFDMPGFPCLSHVFSVVCVIHCVIDIVRTQPASSSHPQHVQHKRVRQSLENRWASMEEDKKSLLLSPETPVRKPFSFIFMFSCKVHSPA